MDPEKPVASLILNRSQIRRLVVNLGGSAGSPLSPLNIERFPEGEDPKETAVDKGELPDSSDGLSEPWTQVFQELLQPSLEIVAVVGFSDRRKTLCGYGPFQKTDHLIGFTPINDSEYRLAYPLSKDHLLSLLVAGLGLDAETPTMDLEAEIPLETLLALAGMIDAGREAQLEAMLARYSDADWEIPFDRILYNSHQGLVSNDYRWLAPVIRSLFPFELSVTPESLIESLNRLEEIGWVENRAADLWSFTEVFDLPRRQLVAMINFGILSIHRQAQTGIERLHLGMLRTMATLWSLEYRDKGVGKQEVRIGMVSGPDLTQALYKVLEIVVKNHSSFQTETVSQEPLPTAGGNQTVCPQCNTPGKSGDRFCGACGAELK